MADRRTTVLKAKTSWMRTLAVCIALTLVATACGGGDAEETAESSDTASEETASQPDGEDDQVEVDDTDAEEAVNESDVDEPSEPEDDVAEEPAEVEEAEEAPEPEAAGDQDNETGEIPQLAEEDPADDNGDVALTSPGFIDTDPDSEFCVAARNIDVDDVLADDDPFGAGLFEGLDGVYAELQPLAPAELEDDIVSIREFVAQIIPILQEGDILSPDTAAELEALNTAAVDESGERFDAYLTQVCGVDGTAGFGGGVGGGGGETLDETISLDSAGSFTGTLEEGTYDLYQLGVFEGSTLTITMESAGDFELDPLLRVVDPSGAELENDDAPDDAGLGLFDSQVVIDSTVGGLYMIETRSFLGTGSGEFTLTVEVG